MVIYLIGNHMGMQTSFNKKMAGGHVEALKLPLQMPPIDRYCTGTNLIFRWFFPFH